MNELFKNYCAENGVNFVEGDYERAYSAVTQYINSWDYDTYGDEGKIAVILDWCPSLEVYDAYCRFVRAQ